MPMNALAAVTARAAVLAAGAWAAAPAPRCAVRAMTGHALQVSEAPATTSRAERDSRRADFEIRSGTVTGASVHQNRTPHARLFDHGRTVRRQHLWRVWTSNPRDRARTREAGRDRVHRDASPIARAAGSLSTRRHDRPPIPALAALACDQPVPRGRCRHLSLAGHLARH